MDRHLDEAALRDLEAKDARAVAHFRDHLARPCAQCEEFLASAPARLWWLEAEADRLLLLHGASPASTADASGYGAVRRAMRIRKLRRAVGTAAAAAAAIAAGVWLLVVPARVPDQDPSREWTGVKSASGEEAGQLELSGALVSPTGEVSPVGPGGRARAGDTLVLRYRATRAGPAHLVKASPGQKPQALGQFALSSGQHDLADSGGVSGVSLGGERGEVRLWLVQSASPLTAEGAIAAALDPTPGRGVAVAAFLVRVDSAEN